MTLGLLSAVASFLHTSSPLLPPTILAAYLAISPAFHQAAGRHPDTRELLATGWTPVLSAMVISSLGGKILARAIKAFPDIAVFQVSVRVVW